MKGFLVSVVFFYCISCFAETCPADPKNQLDYNDCAIANYDATDKLLNKVYSDIREAYAGDAVFLEKLKLAQRAWIKSRDADIELKYPPNENGYGSSHGMCLSNYKTMLTEQRIKYLKQWLLGHEEGDVCSGSEPRDAYLEMQFGKKYHHYRLKE